MDIGALLGALELSVDRDWARFKLTGFFASGDDDPRDGKGQGFDAIYDNSNFAGGAVQLLEPVRHRAHPDRRPAEGARAACSPACARNKFEGQASFVNPGLLLGGLGVDLELTPKLKAVVNANYLRFHRTGSLELLLFQPGIAQADRDRPRRGSRSTGRS